MFCPCCNSFSFRIVSYYYPVTYIVILKLTLQALSFEAYPTDKLAFIHQWLLRTVHTYYVWPLKLCIRSPAYLILTTMYWEPSLIVNPAYFSFTHYPCIVNQPHKCWQCYSCTFWRQRYGNFWDRYIVSRISSGGEMCKRGLMSSPPQMKYPTMTVCSSYHLILKLLWSYGWRLGM